MGPFRNCSRPQQSPHDVKRSPGILACIVIAILAGFILPAIVPPRAQAQQMKLLTPTTGWVLRYRELMWTTDGGAHWKNVTPPSTPNERVVAAFFLDTQRGWALLSGPITGSDQPRLYIAATNDAGASWSINPVKIPGLNPRTFLLGGGGYIYFLDSLHGWINLSLVSSAAVRGAILVETQDGGRTWKWIDSPGRSGPIYFVDAAEGWLVGGPASKLYVTRDGAASWQAVTLNAPQQAGRAIYPAYSLPVFQNGEDGFLPVTFSGTAGVNFVVSMFATTDGGRTWKPDTVVHGPYPMGMGQPWPTTIVDSTLITGVASDRTLVLTRVSHGSRVSASAAIPLRQAAVAALSFVDSTDGWVLLGYHGQESSIYSTSDGGNSWRDITPRPLRSKPLPNRTGPTMPYFPVPPTEPAAPRIAPHSSPQGVPRGSLALTGSALAANSTLEAQAGKGGGATHTSLRLGIDTCWDKNSFTEEQVVNNTQAWWTNGPYYDYGLYLGGENSKSCLLPTDTTMVDSLASQGRGILPLWVGLQPVCTTGNNY